MLKYGTEDQAQRRLTSRAARDRHTYTGLTPPTRSARVGLRKRRSFTKLASMRKSGESFTETVQAPVTAALHETPDRFQDHAQSTRSHEICPVRLSACCPWPTSRARQ